MQERHGGRRLDEPTARRPGQARPEGERAPEGLQRTADEGAAAHSCAQPGQARREEQQRRWNRAGGTRNPPREPPDSTNCMGAPSTQLGGRGRHASGGPQCELSMQQACPRRPPSAVAEPARGRRRRASLQGPWNPVHSHLHSSLCLNQGFPRPPWPLGVVPAVLLAVVPAVVPAVGRGASRRVARHARPQVIVPGDSETQRRPRPRGSSSHVTGRL